MNVKNLIIVSLAFLSQLAFGYGNDFIVNDKAYIYAPGTNLAPDFDEGHNIITPVIIYYAVDSFEPFMRAAVDKDIQGLREVCKKNIDSIIILGSEIGNFLANNAEISLEVCSSGSSVRQVISIERQNKIRLIVNGYKANPTLQSVAKTPTALPEIFELIFEEMFEWMDGNHINDDDESSYNRFFIHIKSHGSSAYPIFAPSDKRTEQLTKKQLRQLGDKKTKFISNQKRFKIGSGKLAQIFGSVKVGTQNHLGIGGDDSLKLGTNSELVEVEKMFNRKTFEEMFLKLNSKTGLSTSFIFLEACGAQLAKEDPSGLPYWGNSEIPVFGYYISKGFLDYNNIDWQEISSSVGTVNFFSWHIYYALRLRLLQIKNSSAQSGDSLKQESITIKNNVVNLFLARYSNLDFFQVAVGDGQICGLEKSRLVYCLQFDGGVLDKEDTLMQIENLTWVIIDKDQKFKQIFKNCGLTVNGEYRCWTNKDQISRLMDSVNRYQTVAFDPGEDSHREYWHSCGITVDGWLKCWGSNFFCGVNYSLCQKQRLSENFSGDDSLLVEKPFKVGSKGEFLSVATGLYGTCALKNDRKIYCWGYNQPYEDLYLSWGDRPGDEFKQIQSQESFKNVMKFTGTNCGLSIAGQLWCWGENYNSQILGTIQPFPSVPKLVDGRHKYLKIAIGANNICGITDDLNSELRCWGGNMYGQIGDLKSAQTTVYFEQVTIDKGIRYRDLDTGKLFGCGVTVDGKLKCWGNLK